MRPFPLFQTERGTLGRIHAQADTRTLLIAALCLFIGLGLGVLWHSRRAQRSAVNAEREVTAQNAGTLSVGTTAVLHSLQVPVESRPAAAALPVDSTIIAEVKRQIPNFASISLEEGTRRLRESALNDLKAAMSEMESRFKEAQQRVARAQDANAEADKQAALRELQRLQAEQAAKLKEVTARSSAQVEALRQLKESAR